MKPLLFTTMLKYVYWDGEKDHIIHEGELSEGTGHYHGLTWGDGVTYVTCTDANRYIVRRWRQGEQLEALQGDLHQSHQAIWFDGKLYVTNTGKNRIEIWDGEGWDYHAWHLSPCDIEHINAIWCDGEHFYVTEHRQAIKEPSIIRICNLNLETIREYPIGPGVHNVYAENGKLYTLAPGNTRESAAVIECDIETGELTHYWHEEWGAVLVRGLSRDKDSWYIGFSRWEPKRDKRNVGDALIVRLNNQFEEVERLLFEDYGPICDVRLLEGNLAHNGEEYRD